MTKTQRFKFEKEKVFTQRKLKGVNIEHFRNLVEDEYQKLFTQSEYKLLMKVNVIVAQKFCKNIPYSEDDKQSIDASLSISRRLPFWLRKNIAVFEQAHNIKTIWHDYNVENIRSEHQNYSSYE